MSTHNRSVANRRPQSIHWFRHKPADQLERHRKGRLHPSLRGMLGDVRDLMWLDLGRLKDEPATIAGRLNVDVRLVKRLLTSLVELGELTRSDGFIWDERTDRDIAELCNSYAGAKKDLSRKARKFNEREGEELDLESDSPTSPQRGRDDGDDNRGQFDAFWRAFPDGEWKDRKADCLIEFRRIVGGQSQHGEITAAELVTAAGEYAAKCRRQRRDFAPEAPLNWLRRGHWLDYAPVQSDDEHDGNTLPFWDDDAAMDASDADFPLETRAPALCRKRGGWPRDYGPSPTSGERTKLHDRIARTPGLLRQLEREGIEFPSALQDLADIADEAAQASLPSRLHLATVDGRAIA